MMLLKFIQTGFFFLSRLTPRLAARLSVELLFRPRRSARTAHENRFWSTGRPVTFASGCRGRIFGHGSLAVCVVHGWQSRGSKLQPLIEACLQDGLQVVVWDGPGHGDSPGKRTNLAAFSRILSSDLTALDKNWFAIVGHSFGAAAAAYVCKLGLKAERLVLIAAPSSAPGVFQRFWKLIALGRTAQKHFIRLVESEVQIRVDEMSSVGFILELPQKILVFHDRSDEVIPLADAISLKATRSDIDLVVTEKLGHYRIVRSNEVCRAVSGFLAERGA